LLLVVVAAVVRLHPMLAVEAVVLVGLKHPQDFRSLQQQITQLLLVAVVLVALVLLEMRVPAELVDQILFFHL
jgi:hypothetical protein